MSSARKQTQKNMRGKTMATVKVSDENFQSEVLGSSTPVLVDFWAEWCGPCKMIAPALEEISEEMSGAVKIAKVDIDSNQQSAMNYGVRSIPTMILFKNGEAAATMVGAQPKGKIAEWIKQNA
ncbi:thioredoxin [Polycladidibacter stylochi]|uniref:thioredoxin n=1 Tax=Polycladidibacter stylochi TaxID=1807766 RepID=UPI002378183D|nr:thioredoxin [Pseudovibrio stylochi]